MENKVSREDLVKALNNINEPLNLDIMKGKAAMVGEIRTWGGKKFKKQGNGKWVEVSDCHEISKKDHEYQYKERLEESKRPSMHTALKRDEAKWHKEQAEKLSDKEYDDTDFEEKPKDLTQLNRSDLEKMVPGYLAMPEYKAWSKAKDYADNFGKVTAYNKAGYDNAERESVRLHKEYKKALISKIEAKVGEKKKVEKSLQDHFSIINAPLNFNKEEEIKKSDVYYALDDNYNSQSPIGKFKKKGSELKTMASTKKAKYETKKVIIEASKEETMSKIKEAGVECIEGEYGCKFNYNYEATPQNTRDLIHKYNSLSYECEGINKDIKALNVIIKHCEDNKMYDVTARQLISLDDE